jgi:hypothetical protein
MHGGWGGIRTHETLAGLPVFKTGAFNRSATHPSVPNTDERSRSYWQGVENSETHAPALDLPGCSLPFATMPRLAKRGGIRPLCAWN